MKKTISFLSAFAFILLLFAACKNQTASPSDTASASDTIVASTSASSAHARQYLIACIYPETTGDYWGVAYNGCMQALEELSVQGVKGYCVAPANTEDAALQTALLDEALAKGVDGIVLSPVNADAVGAYVTDTFTEENGCPIVLMTNALNADSPWVRCRALEDIQGMGEDAARLAEQATDGQGYFVILGTGMFNSSWATTETVSSGYLEKNTSMKNAYPMEDGIWWSKQATNELTAQFLQDICTSHPDEPLALLVLANSDPTLLDTVLRTTEALPARPQNASLYIINYGFSEKTYAYLQDDRIYGIIGEDPCLAGYSCPYSLLEYLLTGEIEWYIANPYCVLTQDTLDTAESQKYLVNMGIDS